MNKIKYCCHASSPFFFQLYFPPVWKKKHIFASLPIRKYFHTWKKKATFTLSALLTDCLTSAVYINHQFEPYIFISYIKLPARVKEWENELSLSLDWLPFYPLLASIPSSFLQSSTFRKTLPIILQSSTTRSLSKKMQKKSKIKKTSLHLKRQASKWYIGVLLGHWSSSSFF